MPILSIFLSSLSDNSCSSNNNTAMPTSTTSAWGVTSMVKAVAFATLVTIMVMVMVKTMMVMVMVTVVAAMVMMMMMVYIATVMVMTAVMAVAARAASTTSMNAITFCSNFGICVDYSYSC